MDDTLLSASSASSASSEQSDENDCQGQHSHGTEFAVDKTLASIYRISDFINHVYHHNVKEIYIKEISKQIYLREYLERYFERYRLLDTYKDDSGLSPDVARILTKQKCLEAARELNRLAEEKYTELKELQKVYETKKENNEQITVKRFMGTSLKIGRVRRYQQMLLNFTPCFYLTMLKFSQAILTMETKLQDDLSNRLTSESMTKILNSFNLEALIKLLYNIHNLEPPESEASGGSRRHTRRRRYSLRYRKLIKRSKKYKKIIKSHTKKRHNYIRKQNKRKNKSIK